MIMNLKGAIQGFLSNLYILTMWLKRSSWVKLIIE